MMRYLWTLFLPCILFAQQSGNYSAAEMAKLQEVRVDSLAQLPVVTWRYVKIIGRTEAVAWRNFWGTVGGEIHRPLLKFLNRDQLNVQRRGDSLIVPSILGLDLRAYAPVPLNYPAASTIDKLLIIDKNFQIYAAYEFGKLVRWGVVCTGATRFLETPNGRYNFNWKEASRISSESPPGDPWRMRWVSNFYQERGIHTHQSPEVKMAGPASHGCVRMTEFDGKWVYDWSRGWTLRAGKIVAQGSMVIVQGNNPLRSTPKLFTTVNNRPAIIQIALPADPTKVKAGSRQQRDFDARLQNQSSTSK